MENKIPTAEEFYNNFKPDMIFNHLKVKEMMIEFAKLHVKQALETAAEEAELEMYETWIDKQSILNAYLEDNIK